MKLSREPRLYGLFYRPAGRTTWVRLFPRMAYVKSTAVRVFQGWLLKFFFMGKHVELRTLPKRKRPADASVC